MTLAPSRLMLLVLAMLIRSTLFAAEQDIIDYVATHPRGVEHSQGPDGAYKERYFAVPENSLASCLSPREIAEIS